MKDFDYFATTRNSNVMNAARVAVPIHEVFKALGHPARVTIVQALANEERCVYELVERVGLGWSTVSRHLSVLREAGVLTDEKRGLQVFYRLNLPCVSRFIACLESPTDFPELYAAPANRKGCCS